MNDDQRRSSTSKMGQYFVTPQFGALDFAGLGIGAVQLKHLFGDIHTDYAMLYVASSCSSGELRLFHFGSQMPSH